MVDEEEEQMRFGFSFFFPHLDNNGPHTIFKWIFSKVYLSLNIAQRCLSAESWLTVLSPKPKASKARGIN